jgi:hypothetical protein
MLLNKNFEMQGGVRNYLGKTPEVTAPKFWQSSENSPPTELSYITEAEKGLLLEANLHGSLMNNQPNVGASGILSFDGWGDASDGFGGGGADANDGFGGGDNNNNNNNDNYGDGGWENTQSYNDFNETPVNTNFGNDNDNKPFEYPDPVLPPGVVSNNFDYETDAYSGDVGIDAGYGLGEITNATYNKDTGLVDIEQTPGIINTEQYQTANLGAFLDSPDVSDKDKINTLNQLQALSNSDLKGSKLSDIETDFVMENLDLAFNNIKDQTKYSKYTSSIDENATTFSKDMSENPLSTVVKSGGIVGTMIRGVTDTYKNNKALGVLGYTGKTIKYNPDGSGDFKYDGNYLTGNVGGDERDAINQLTPLAANLIGNTTPQNSMVNNYFNNMQSQNVSDVQKAYDQAKANLNMTLTPLSSQFGYSQAPYGGFTATNLANNPYNIDYLKTRGLI